jgi:hypothetical protein
LEKILPQRGGDYFQNPLGLELLQADTLDYICLWQSEEDNTGICTFYRLSINTQFLIWTMMFQI